MMTLLDVDDDLKCRHMIAAMKHCSDFHWCHGLAKKQKALLRTFASGNAKSI
jgi:hypothetical protein